MQRTKIDGSSNITSVGYDPATQTMEIEFNSFGDKKNGIYTYQGANVPSLHQQLMSAQSKGHFFQKFIRNDKTLKVTKVQ